MTGKLIGSLYLMLMPVLGLALEFKSIAPAKAILYDGPSSVASKKFILSQLYPVEVIVTLSDMVKVRDAEGGLYWLEPGDLSDLRTVMVTASSTEMHVEASAGSSVLGLVEKQVVMMLEDAEASNGWIKVRGVDGLVGYIPINAVWGY